MTWTCFSTKKNYNAEEAFTDLLKLTLRTNRNPTPVTTVNILYMKGASETISRILQPYNNRVAYKPTTTLRRLLTNGKDRDEPNNRQGAVYKIKCSDCPAAYFGETDRNLNTRLTELKRATRNGDASNHIAVHHQQTKHNIDWDSAQWLICSTNYFQRLTIHLTLKMTSAKVVETSVTKNSSSKNYSRPDDHNIRTNNTVVMEREVGSILNFSGA